MFQPEAFEISDNTYINNQKESIPEILLKNTENLLIELDHKPKLGHRNRTRGFVKVQDGCNNACSFCLTTIARGASVSTTPENVVKRVRQLENMGIKEIVLTGVQLGSWGKDLEPKSRLSSLLEYLLEHSEVPRIRLSSVEPWDIDQNLVDLLNHPRIMPHLHIPLQSGSDVILKLMRRPVNQEQFSQVLELIRKTSPKTAISTDVIAGFPGETDELFEESFSFIQECNFNGGHVFSFSPMPGTFAQTMSDQVKPATIKMRTKRLLDHFRSQAADHKMGKVGQSRQVLFESKKTSEEGIFYRGFSEDYQRVVCFGNEMLVNQIRDVEIIGVEQNGDLLGVVGSESQA